MIEWVVGLCGKCCLIERVFCLCGKFCLIELGFFLVCFLFVFVVVMLGVLLDRTGFVVVLFYLWLLC